MRKYNIDRKTNETNITMSLNLDTQDFESKINTGVGFFDHMLELFAKHSEFAFSVDCKGDLNVDAHHSIEDIGICLGKAIKEALGDKRGIKRYASVNIPMDESLANVSIDISGRPFTIFNADFKGKCGDFDLELVEEFFRAIASYGGITLHINLLYGQNNHHKVEAIFKAFARAIKEAVKIEGDELPSSKGVLE